MISKTSAPLLPDLSTARQCRHCCPHVVMRELQANLAKSNGTMWIRLGSGEFHAPTWRTGPGHAPLPLRNIEPPSTPTPIENIQYI